MLSTADARTSASKSCRRDAKEVKTWARLGLWDDSWNPWDCAMMANSLARLCRTRLMS